MASELAAITKVLHLAAAARGLWIKTFTASQMRDLYNDRARVGSHDKFGLAIARLYNTVMKTRLPGLHANNFSEGINPRRSPTRTTRANGTVKLTKNPMKNIRMVVALDATLQVKGFCIYENTTIKDEKIGEILGLGVYGPPRKLGIGTLLLLNALLSLQKARARGQQRHDSVIALLSWSGTKSKAAHLAYLERFYGKFGFVRATRTTEDGHPYEQMEMDAPFLPPLSEVLRLLHLPDNLNTVCPLGPGRGHGYCG
jgi:hypothetical protein